MSNEDISMFERIRMQGYGKAHSVWKGFYEIHVASQSLGTGGVSDRNHRYRTSERARLYSVD